jgi:hypothetical protein
MGIKDTKRKTFKSVIDFGAGYASGIKGAVCAVGNLLDKGLLTPHGTIHTPKVGTIRKGELWSYVYYLWYHNHTSIDTFKQMTIYQNHRAKASAVRFVEAIHRVLGFDTNTKPLGQLTKDNLVAAIHTILSREQDIKIPILQRLYQQINRADEIMPREFQRLGLSGAMNVKVVPNVEIITDAKNLQSAQQNGAVKVGLGLTFSRS